MRNELRELKGAKHKVEMDRLQSLKTIEVMKSHLNNAEHDYLEVTEKNEILEFENERLKNELMTAIEKLKIFEKESKRRVPVNDDNWLSSKIDIKESKVKIRPKNVNTIKTSNIRNNLEKLDFSGINDLGQNLKNF